MRDCIFPIYIPLVGVYNSDVSNRRPTTVRDITSRHMSSRTNVVLLVAKGIIGMSMMQVECSRTRSTFPFYSHSLPPASNNQPVADGDHSDHEALERITNAIIIPTDTRPTRMDINFQLTQMFHPVSLSSLIFFHCARSTGINTVGECVWRRKWATWLPRTFPRTWWRRAENRIHRLPEKSFFMNKLLRRAIEDGSFLWRPTMTT